MKTDNNLPGAKKKKKIILVDDHPIVRQGIKQIIEMSGEYSVIDEASTANEAIKCVNREKPDLMIIDITLSGSVSGIDLVKTLRERHPDILTLILSMHDETIFVERVIRSGAKGYLMKEVAPKKILQALEKIFEGGIYLSEQTSEKLIEKLVRGTQENINSSIDILSDREFEIFQMLGTGFSTKEIASKLGLSIYTVESHKRNIKKKMKLKDSAELLKHAIQWVIMKK